MPRPRGRLAVSTGLNEVPSGKTPLDAVVIVQSETDLLEVVRALCTTGGLAPRLHGREQERDEHGNDGDDHQQLDQREAATRMTISQQSSSRTRFGRAEQTTPEETLMGLAR